MMTSLVRDLITSLFTISILLGGFAQAQAGDPPPPSPTWPAPSAPGGPGSDAGDGDLVPIGVIAQTSPAAAVVAASRKQMQVVDLSQTLQESSTFYPSLFPGMNADALPVQPRDALEFGRKIFPGGTPFGFDPASGSTAASITTGEHTGTHMDAPNHFIGSGGDIAGHAVERLACPLAVIDIRDQARGNSKLPITRDMVVAWEAENGSIPDGAMVCILTGYEHSAGDKETHHPGFTVQAADYMRRERRISGVGTDSLSPDISGDLSFPVHKRLLGDQCMILENLRNLDAVPANGASVLMAPLAISAGSGSPTRVVAFVGTAPAGEFEVRDLTHRLDGQTPFLDGSDPTFRPPEKPLLGGLGEEVSKGLKLPKIKLPKIDLGGLIPGKPVMRETTARTMINGYYGGYFQMGVSTGTHIDFPRRSQSGGDDAASYQLARLFGGAVVVDMRDVPQRSTMNAESLQQRLAGRSVSGAYLVLWTGRSDNRHPGLTADAATWAMSQSARGILTDAADIDPASARNRPAERAVHEAYGVTGGFLRDPGQLPASGATLAILPMPVARSPSAPARILAYLPR